VSVPAGSRCLYYFRLEDQVPENHLLRLIDRHVNFEFVRAKLKDSYSDTGRPSIDPELRLRLLLVGYLYGVTSACAEFPELGGSDFPELTNPKLIDLLSRINGGVVPIPPFYDAAKGIDRRPDKVCVAVQILRQRFGHKLRTVPLRWRDPLPPHLPSPTEKGTPFERVPPVAPTTDPSGQGTSPKVNGGVDGRRSRVSPLHRECASATAEPVWSVGAFRSPWSFRMRSISSALRLACSCVNSLRAPSFRVVLLPLNTGKNTHVPRAG